MSTPGSFMGGEMLVWAQAADHDQPILRLEDAEELYPSSPVRLSACTPFAFRPVRGDRRYEVVLSSSIAFATVPTLADVGSSYARTLRKRPCDVGLNVPQVTLEISHVDAQGRTFRQDEFGNRIRKTGRPPHIDEPTWKDMDAKSKTRAKEEACNVPHAALQSGAMPAADDGDEDWEEAGRRIAKFQASMELQSQGLFPNPFPDPVSPVGFAHGDDFIDDSTNIRDGGENVDNIEPSMPCSSHTHRQHRCRIHNSLPWNALVARPVGKAEFEEQSKRGQQARETRTAEWSKLWEKQVWDHSGWQEWAHVSADARRQGRELHIGRLFGIRVEKSVRAP